VGTNGRTGVLRDPRGIGLGGILVLVGIILAITWSAWEGLFLVLIGLATVGWFAKGKWY
jgi:hypothetical protein